MTEEQTNGEISEEIKEEEPLPNSGITIEGYEKLKQEATEYKDKYLRMLADADNLRKRMNKERQELVQSAVQRLIIEFIQPIDQIEQVMKFTNQMPEEIRNWVAGFQMILNQFKTILADHNVYPFDSQGQKFDPARHEAVEIVHTNEYPEGTVVVETLRGYRIGDRILRPARVKVAQPLAQETEIKSKEEGV